MGTRGILDALLDRSRGTHDLDRGNPAVLLLVYEQAEGDDGVEVVGEASNGAEAVDSCARAAPDVVLMDIDDRGDDDDDIFDLDQPDPPVLFGGFPPRQTRQGGFNL